MNAVAHIASPVRVGGYFGNRSPDRLVDLVRAQCHAAPSAHVRHKEDSSAIFPPAGVDGRKIGNRAPRQTTS
jgi:hypothetical protein